MQKSAPRPETRRLPGEVLQAATALQQGNAGKREWKIIWEYFRPKLDGIAHHYGLQDFDRDDVVQKIFIRVFKYKEKLRYPRQFETWFLAIAYNEMKRFVSQPRRLVYVENFPEERDWEGEAEEQIPAPDDADEKSISEAAHQRLLQQIKACIDAMPPRRRQACRFCWSERLPQKEVAAIMQISVKGVQRQLNLAKKFLRQCLASKTPETETME